MKPTFFDSPSKFRAWLRTHHRTATELWVGYRKKKTGIQSITWQESVDEALCFGWIDGIRRSVDAQSYINRFTPRRPGSTWSAINTRRAAELIKEGRMRVAGRKAFEARDAAKTAAISSGRDVPSFDAACATQFKASPAAWEFFLAQPPGYRKMATWFVMSGKREETRARRLGRLIALSASRRRLVPM
jgi:uncharacterized protein YdeI (YjbR/CyaY-like superfamily)